jgi:prevent-host-death family protein
MAEVGVRELKQHASEILRRVREKRESITITYRGRAVARLVPIVSADDMRAEAQTVLADMDDLAKEIGALWPAGITASQAVDEQRREL